MIDQQGPHAAHLLQFENGRMCTRTATFIPVACEFNDVANLGTLVSEAYVCLGSHWLPTTAGSTTTAHEGLVLRGKCDGPLVAVGAKVGCPETVYCQKCGLRLRGESFFVDAEERTNAWNR